MCDCYNALFIESQKIQIKAFKLVLKIPHEYNKLFLYYLQVRISSFNSNENYLLHIFLSKTISHIYCALYILSIWRKILYILNILSINISVN